MHRFVLPAVAIAAAAAIAPAPCRGAESTVTPEAPDWAKSLRLVVRGGPTLSDVEISLNGSFVLLVQGEPPWFHEIADLVRPGINELKVVLKKPDEARQAGDNLRIEVRRVVEAHRGIETSGDPLLDVVVPGDAPADPACEKVVRFRAGPEPEAPKDLKNHYWFYASGPPAKVSAAVMVNGELVYEASAGNTWFDITPFVHKGKNEVSFEIHPTCLVPKSAREGPFVLGVGPAKLEHDVVRLTEPPQAELEIDPVRDKDDKTVRRSFRAW